MAVTLQLTDRADYSQAVGRTQGLEPAGTPGRGLVKGKPPLEFQTALPVVGDSERERLAQIREISAEMESWKGPRAKPIPVKPEIIHLSELCSLKTRYLKKDQGDPFQIPIGLEIESLEPFGVDLADGPHFLVSGPIQSGKSTLLQTWLLSLVNKFSPERLSLFLVDFQEEGLYPFRGIPHTKAYITNENMLEKSLEEMEQILTERQLKGKGLTGSDKDSTSIIRKRTSSELPAMLLVIDDYDLFADRTSTNLQERIVGQIRQSKDVGYHLLISAPISEVTTGYSPLLKILKANPNGFLLGSTDSGHLNTFNVRLPIGESGKVLPSGEGIFARRGKYQKVKIATPREGEGAFQDWINNIVKRK